MEAALQASPSTLAMAEPFLFLFNCAGFNSLFYLFALSEHGVPRLFTATLYELRSPIAADKKRELLIEVAKWSGDGLRTTCLKMPTN